MDFIFFLASKLLRPLLAPSTWLVITPLVAWLLYRWGFKSTPQVLIGFEVVLLLIIGFYPVGQWLAYPLENYSKQPEINHAPKGIIVLGGAWATDKSNFWNHWEFNHAADREVAFVILAKKFPQADLVFTGGSGKVLRQDLKEAEIARGFYQDMGLDVSRIVFEDQSRNTFENALLSHQLVKPDPKDPWLLLTSAYHMPRSMGVFKKQGWNVIPYPVDHVYSQATWIPKWFFSKHLFELDLVTFEWIGLWVYYLTGKTESLFPDS